MQHVGNDIVDVRHPHAQAKIRDTRFLKRVFLPEEEEAIFADCQPDVLLWAFWSAKEAAYKALQKEQLDIPSTPRKYLVTFHSEDRKIKKLSSGSTRRLHGTVDTPMGRVRVTTTMTTEYVHSIAQSSPAPWTKVMWNIIRMWQGEAATNESAFVRDAAKRHLARNRKVLQSDIDITRQLGPRGLGPPVVRMRNHDSAIDISLSHDGEFAAYAFCLCT